MGPLIKFNAVIVKTMNDIWYRLVLQDIDQEQLLKEAYPNLHDARLYKNEQRKPWEMAFCEINIFNDCLDCNDQCVDPESHNKDHYVLHDSVYCDGYDIDRQFMVLAVSIGCEIHKDQVDVSREFRVKL
jgi:hypothetical protein